MVARRVEILRLISWMNQLIDQSINERGCGGYKEGGPVNGIDCLKENGVLLARVVNYVDHSILLD